MDHAKELRHEADRILTTLSARNSKAVRRLLPVALNEVQRAVTNGTHASLALWASKEPSKADVKAALFVSCTAALRVIDKFEPARFAAADRLLLSARHLVARQTRSPEMTALIA